MANYDIVIDSIIGLHVQDGAHIRVCVASLGVALWRRLVQTPTPIPDGAVAIPNNIDCLAHTAEPGEMAGAMPIDDPPNFANLDPSRDDGWIRCHLRVPGSTSSDPTGAVGSWCRALGGTVKAARLNQGTGEIELVTVPG